jgi:hypothetical protein
LPWLLGTSADTVAAAAHPEALRGLRGGNFLGWICLKVARGVPEIFTASIIRPLLPEVSSIWRLSGSKPFGRSTSSRHRAAKVLNGGVQVRASPLQAAAPRVNWVPTHHSMPVVSSLLEQKRKY